MFSSRFLFFVLIMFTMCRFSDSKKEQSTDEQPIAEKQPVLELPQPPAHPRILLLKNEEEDIKKTINSDSSLNAVHQLIIRESNRMINKPLVEYKVKGRRLLEKSRECRKKVFFLSYAWRMTGDKKYFLRAEKELLNVSSFPDWNPSHFLDVAEMTMAVAIGYDWLFTELSEVSKQKLREAITKKGLEPSLLPDNNWWVTEDGNWNQVCNAGMAFGALAIYDEKKELSQKIINRSIQSVKLAMRVYEPDGVFPEGYAYWSYGTTFNVYLIDALSKAFSNDFGLSENKGFMKTASYLLHMVGPTGLNFNYSDGEAKCRLNPAMFWFANRLSDKTLLFSEKKIMREEDNLWGGELPAAMIWGTGMNLNDLAHPQPLIWKGGGKNPVALMRTSWNNDAIYVGLKGGSPSNGHGHMDIGSFVMDALGERWAMDFGGQDYNALESKGLDLWSNKQQSDRWNIFRLNNKAHNTLTFNNELQSVTGNAPVVSSTSTLNFLSATVDLTSIYKNDVTKSWRGVAIVDKQYVLVRDEIESTSKTSTIQWTMITSTQVKLLDNQSAELTQNGKKLLLKIVEPATAVLKTWSTTPPNEYDEPNPGTVRIGFEVSAAPDSKVLLIVVLIPVTSKEVSIQKPMSLSNWK